MKKKIGNYVVKCIKNNNNEFGFGYKHKAGQYVSYSGKPVNSIQDAHVYNSNNVDEECAVDDLDGWEKYYVYVPVKIGSRYERVKL